MKSLFLTASLLIACAALFAQDAFIFRLCLKDKGMSPFTIEEASAFLSQKSIDRRISQGLSVDEHDLPVDTDYLRCIEETGAEIRVLSKWAETVAVKISDTASVLPQLRNLVFIDTLYCVWKGSAASLSPVEAINDETPAPVVADNDTYGAGLVQISMHNGQRLHSEGRKGAGVEIAVIDAGFAGADTINFFDFDKVLEVKNFNHETSNPLRGTVDHGTKVLSCMLSSMAGEFVGTAPDANYRLYRTEVNATEFPVEEDYWIAAVEYADSAGIDIISSSLGYFTFDDASMNHRPTELDGHTIPVSRAASLAASRGIMLFNAAGNEGNNSWGKIICPGDAANMVTVGSVQSDSVRASVSSRGYTADGRIKPDLMAMGSATAIVTGYGSIINSNGTSFATPILAGLGACLRGAFPAIPASDLINAIKAKGNHSENPDSLYGYGIPDVNAVYDSLLNLSHIQPLSEWGKLVRFFIDHNRLYIVYNNDSETLKTKLEIYSLSGSKVFQTPVFSDDSVDISSLKKGVYIARIFLNSLPVTFKFII
jgi:subtilisin family serine protease